MAPIPAIDLLPAEFTHDLSGIPPWMFIMSTIPPGQSYNLYITSQISKCYRYYRKDKSCVITPTEPPLEQYINEIGNAYQSTEKDKPQCVWFVRAYCRELKRPVAWIIDKSSVQKAIAKTFTSNLNIFLTDDNVLNAIAEVTYDKDAPPQIMYSVRFHIKPADSPKVIASAQESWFPDQYSNGGNDPFTAPVTPPAQAGVPMSTNGAAPPTAAAPAAGGDDDW
jgi:hypothetical protein